jgi:hypothetical protein
MASLWVLLLRDDDVIVLELFLTLHGAVRLGEELEAGRARPNSRFFSQTSTVP